MANKSHSHFRIWRVPSADWATEMHIEEAQAQPEAANTLHHTTVVNTGEEVPGETVPLNR